MMYLSDDRTTHRAEAQKAIFQHRPLILRYGAVQQTTQIAAARDLALFARLSIAFNTSLETWLNQQTQYDLWQTEQHRKN